MNKCWVEGCRTVAVRHVFLVLCAEHLHDAVLAVVPEVHAKYPLATMYQTGIKWRARFGEPPALSQAAVFDATYGPIKEAPATRHPSLVYFLRRGELTKIGTSTNLSLRLRSMSLPPDAIVECTEPGGYELERSLHQKFAADRLDGSEWFRRSPRLLEYIERTKRRRG